jgi:hypothetical protein
MNRERSKYVIGGSQHVNMSVIVESIHYCTALKRGTRSPLGTSHSKVVARLLLKIYIQPRRIEEKENDNEEEEEGDKSDEKT